MATQTTNYQFPKYESTDIPDLTDEYNEFADKADAAINNAMMAATNAGTAAQNAQQQAQAASTKADDVEDTVSTMSVQVNTALNTANDAMSLAQTNEDDIAGIETDVTQLQSSVTTLQTGKAPTNHASTASTYGSGTASQFGHVKLSDTPTASNGETSGVAATPKSVQDLHDVISSAFVGKTSAVASVSGWNNVSGVGGLRMVGIPEFGLLQIMGAVDRGDAASFPGATLGNLASIGLGDFVPNSELQITAFIAWNYDSASASATAPHPVTIDTSGNVSIASTTATFNQVTSIPVYINLSRFKNDA